MFLSFGSIHPSFYLAAAGRRWQEETIMGRYVKRPVEVEATQWFKDGDHPNVTMLPVDPDCVVSLYCAGCGHSADAHGFIETLEGGHRVCPGDWIITGVRGERYPCKPDIFEQTYEEVPDPEEIEFEQQIRQEQASDS